MYLTLQNLPLMYVSPHCSNNYCKTISALINSNISPFSISVKQLVEIILGGVNGLLSYWE
jgi:hypothetical protein